MFDKRDDKTNDNNSGPITITICAGFYFIFWSPWVGHQRITFLKMWIFCIVKKKIPWRLAVFFFFFSWDDNKTEFEYTKYKATVKIWMVQHKCSMSWSASFKFIHSNLYYPSGNFEEFWKTLEVYYTVPIIEKENV